MLGHDSTGPLVSKLHRSSDLLSNCHVRYDCFEWCEFEWCRPRRQVFNKQCILYIKSTKLLGRISPLLLVVVVVYLSLQIWF